MTEPFARYGTVRLGRGALNTFERDVLLADDGRWFRRDRLTHPGAVVIVPRTADGGVVMIHQYRPVIRRWVWELPAGLLELHEDPRAAAGRECREETGFAPGELADLGTLVTSPGILAETIHVFEASDLDDVGREPEAHEEELARVAVMSPAGLADLAQGADLENAITIAALARAGLVDGLWSEHR